MDNNTNTNMPNGGGLGDDVQTPQDQQQPTSFEIALETERQAVYVLATQTGEDLNQVNEAFGIQASRFAALYLDQRAQLQQYVESIKKQTMVALLAAGRIDFSEAPTAAERRARNLLKTNYINAKAQKEADKQSRERRITEAKQAVQDNLKSRDEYGLWLTGKNDPIAEFNPKSDFNKKKKIEERWATFLITAVETIAGSPAFSFKSSQLIGWVSSFAFGLAIAFLVKWAAEGISVYTSIAKERRAELPFFTKLKLYVGLPGLVFLTFGIALLRLGLVWGAPGGIILKAVGGTVLVGIIAWLYLIWKVIKNETQLPPVWHQEYDNRHVAHTDSEKILQMTLDEDGGEQKFQDRLIEISDEYTQSCATAFALSKEVYDPAKELRTLVLSYEEQDRELLKTIIQEQDTQAKNLFIELNGLRDMGQQITTQDLKFESPEVLLRSYIGDLDPILPNEMLVAANAIPEENPTDSIDVVKNFKDFFLQIDEQPTKPTLVSPVATVPEPEPVQQITPLPVSAAPARPVLPPRIVGAPVWKTGGKK